MGYLEGLDRDSCPFCHQAFDDYVESESYAGKWVSIDVPTDIMIGEAVAAKDYLYRCCKAWNEKKHTVRFNLDSLR